MMTIFEIEYDTLVQRLSERDALVDVLRKELEKRDALVATLRKKINMLENDTVRSLQASVEFLTEDNRRLNQANKRLRSKQQH